MKAATRTVEIQGLEINVPVGSMDPPTEWAKWNMESLQDPTNWKMPVRPFSTFDRSQAEDYAYCLNWFCGGHEWEEQPNAFADWTLYTVSSRGYYHYVGA